MRLKPALVSILLIPFSCSLAQTPFFEWMGLDINGIDKLELNECDLIDEITTSHSKYFPLNEMYSIEIYNLNDVDCKHYKEIIGNKNKVDFSRNVLKEYIPTEIILIPDFFNNSTIFYTPHSLFSIRNSRTDYEFKFYQKTYEIKSSKLKSFFWLKELIPNANRHFGKSKIRTEIILKNGDTQFIESQDNISLRKLEENTILEIDSIKITLTNTFEDELYMDFKVVN